MRVLILVETSVFSLCRYIVKDARIPMKVSKGMDPIPEILPSGRKSLSRVLTPKASLLGLRIQHINLKGIYSEHSSQEEADSDKQ